jgi:pimeloyl-ACP methyl ester carboxylesterase
LTESIPSVELVELAGGHYIFVESPGPFRDAVTAFLQKG